MTFCVFPGKHLIVRPLLNESGRKSMLDVHQRIKAMPHGGGYPSAPVLVLGASDMRKLSLTTGARTSACVLLIIMTDRRRDLIVNFRSIRPINEKL